MPPQTDIKQKLLVIALIIVGVVFTAFFGMRAVHAFKKFDGPRPPRGEVETDVELIRDWMTVPFISHTYHVPDKIIFEALDISPSANHEKSLKEINEEFFPDKDGYVLELVKETVLAHQPPPPPDSAPTEVPPPTPPAP
ncbi:MAG: hypothetical protein U0V02_04935 [Anaerolineales bacterium]